MVQEYSGQMVSLGGPIFLLRVVAVRVQLRKWFAEQVLTGEQLPPRGRVLFPLHGRHFQLPSLLLQALARIPGHLLMSCGLKSTCLLEAVEAVVLVRLVQARAVMVEILAGIRQARPVRHLSTRLVVVVVVR
jgi:hypothetical protein